MTNTIETGLQLVKSAKFGEIEADIYSDTKDMFMTIDQLAQCLEYSARRGVEMIVTRNPYLKNQEFSVTHKMFATDGKAYNTRIFNEDGIYEVSFLAKTSKAKEFRKWVRGILKSLRSGELQLSNQGYSLTSEMIESAIEKYFDPKFQTLESHLTQHIDTRLNSMSNAFTYIQKLLEQNSKPLFVVDADWKSKMFKRVDELVNQQPQKYINSKTVLRTIYNKMNSVYGIVWDQESRDFRTEHNIAGKPQTMELISDKEQLKSLFECILNDMFIYENQNVVTEKKIPSARDIIAPLIEKYNDKSKGGTVTFRKVYKNMDVNWYRKEKAYIKCHRANNPPQRIKLIEQDFKLMNRFKKTVKGMMAG